MMRSSRHEIHVSKGLQALVAIFAVPSPASSPLVLLLLLLSLYHMLSLSFPPFDLQADHEMLLMMIKIWNHGIVVGG